MSENAIIIASKYLCDDEFPHSDYDEIQIYFNNSVNNACITERRCVVYQLYHIGLVDNKQNTGFKQNEKKTNTLPQLLTHHIFTVDIKQNT